MSVARRRELDREENFNKFHPERYDYKHTLHQIYMGDLLEHVLTLNDEKIPENQSLYDFSGPESLGRIRARAVDSELHLGLYIRNPYLGAWYSTKKTWHTKRCAHDFKFQCMPDMVHFTWQVRHKLVHLTHRGSPLLTSELIDKLELFLASCLAECDVGKYPYFV